MGSIKEFLEHRICLSPLGQNIERSDKISNGRQAIVSCYVCSPISNFPSISLCLFICEQKLGYAVPAVWGPVKITHTHTQTIILGYQLTTQHLRHF